MDYDALPKKMVDFAQALRFEDLSEKAIHDAKARVIDSIGVGLAAYLAPPVRIARQITQTTAGDQAARVWGTLQYTTPDMAAFVNGTMVRYLDLNDAYRTRDASHPSDNLPGILAMAEATGASGAEFILALAISYEIQCRFTDDVPFNDAGWDQPVVGAMACALAVGKLLEMSEDEMHHAVSLAVVPNLCTYQSRAGELAMWKGAAGPNGARNGIFAAQLAAGGMTGPYNPFEGIFGVWNQTTNEPYDVNIPTPDKVRIFGISQSNIKTYPVRDSCQLPIDTALELREAVSANEIASLKIRTYKSAYIGAVKDKELWAPQTRETADHSMPFNVAVTLCDGEVTPDTFDRNRFLDEDVLSLIGNMTVDIDDDFSSQTPATRNCWIEATTKDGSTKLAHRTLTQAKIEEGMDDGVLERKFRTCTKALLDTDRQDAIIGLGWMLDELDDVGIIVDQLAV
jgi:2-methylcitrate dehydratase